MVEIVVYPSTQCTTAKLVVTFDGLLFEGKNCFDGIRWMLEAEADRFGRISTSFACAEPFGLAHRFVSFSLRPR